MKPYSKDLRLRVLSAVDRGVPREGVAKTKRPEWGYRTRKDKKFCDKTCRDRYHYLRKTKPVRQAARSLRQ